MQCKEEGKATTRTAPSVTRSCYHRTSPVPFPSGPNTQHKVSHNTSDRTHFALFHHPENLLGHYGNELWADCATAGPYGAHNPVSHA